jgi:hypothetical protein
MKERAVHMLVKTQCREGGITGLWVGADNARHYFPRGEMTVELLLDHLEIACGLEPEFWEGRAEIYDPRLCAWLELKNPSRRAGQKEMPLAMIPAGKNTFRLQPVSVCLGQKSRPAS